MTSWCYLFNFNETTSKNIDSLNVDGQLFFKRFFLFKANSITIPFYNLNILALNSENPEFNADQVESNLKWAKKIN